MASYAPPGQLPDPRIAEIEQLTRTPSVMPCGVGVCRRRATFRVTYQDSVVTVMCDEHTDTFAAAEGWQRVDD